ncbi:MAG: NAD(P)H-dependent oxidoreductase [Bacilli bacterium]|nr:NAD(P)H-dependent oxidoreductase [Bacilli bacterium]
MKKSLAFLLPTFILEGCSVDNAGSQSSVDKTIALEKGNVLVAYFSVTNNTEKLALYAQEHLQSDIFEIVPEVEYTSADIDYNSDCRANSEQNDDKARPSIKNTISDISQYDTIVLGYPIWWGQAPKILYTFVESYDFSNKIIVPFCTSGSSPIGTSATNLAKSAPKANWLEGKRFAAGTSKEEVGKWLDNCFAEKKDMKLSIDEKELEVAWEENASSKAIKDLCPLSIEMHRYGGFEQVGSIGRSITSNDKNMTTSPGDIVLYSSNQIVIFYGSNTWEYTKLGHIDLSDNELNALLNKESVSLIIK